MFVVTVTGCSAEFVGDWFLTYLTCNRDLTKYRYSIFSLCQWQVLALKECVMLLTVSII